MKIIQMEGRSDAVATGTLENLKSRMGSDRQLRYLAKVSVIEAPVGQLSEKPRIVRDAIVFDVSDGTKVGTVCPWTSGRRLARLGERSDLRRHYDLMARYRRI